MGFEYRINATLNAAQRTSVAQLFDHDPRAHCVKPGGTAWELRAPGNNGQMPDCTISLDAEGFDLCQYASSHAWHGLDALHHLLTSAGIDFQLLEVDV